MHGGSSSLCKFHGGKYLREIVLLLWTSSFIVISLPKLVNPFYQFSARGTNYRLIKSLFTSNRNWKTEFFFVSNFWARNPIEVARDSFPPYTSELGSLRPEGMLLFYSTFSIFYCIFLTPPSFSIFSCKTAFSEQILS